MRTEITETGGNSRTHEFRPEVEVKVVPNIVGKGVNENGFTLFFLDTGEVMTEIRYIHEYGPPKKKGNDKIKPQHYKGPNPDRTKINFKNT